MRDKPLRYESPYMIDYVNIALKMAEIKQDPSRRFISEHESLVGWVVFGIIFTGILLVAWRM